VIDKIRPSVESLGATADRVTQAVLLSVLSESQQRDQWESTPVGASLSNPIANLENRAQRLAIQLQDSPVIEKLNIVSQTRRIGTGPWQALSLPSSILEITPRGKSVAMLQETLSQHQPPIWTNVFSDHLEIVLRTVEPADDAHIVNALSNS
jgi:seryl-tRNA(Sec) selenium transferase